MGRLPWYALIGAKIALSRLPMAYSLWKSIGLFSHGEMQNPDYAFRVFQHHRELSGASGPFVGLEMGPGDSLFSAIAAKAFGATHCYLMDVGDFANRDIEQYRAMALYLRDRSPAPPPDISLASNLEDVLSTCSATYRTDGLAGYRSIPDASVDVVWSHAVLEHVRRHEFLDVMRETRRVLKPDGVATHVVDLQDHLGGALNNLRIGSTLWEKDWFAPKSGFYTNRLRISEMLELFERAGFDVRVTAKETWPDIPTPRRSISREFQQLGDDDLKVRAFTVVLRAA